MTARLFTCTGVNCLADTRACGVQGMLNNATASFRLKYDSNQEQRRQRVGGWRHESNHKHLIALALHQNTAGNGRSRLSITVGCLQTPVVAELLGVGFVGRWPPGERLIRQTSAGICQHAG